MPQTYTDQNGEQFQVETTQEAVDRNNEIRDKAAAWILRVIEGEDTELLGAKANTIVNMYAVASREAERFKGLLDAKAENASQQFVVHFKTDKGE